MSHLKNKELTEFMYGTNSPNYPPFVSVQKQKYCRVKRRSKSVKSHPLNSQQASRVCA